MPLSTPKVLKSHVFKFPRASAGQLGPRDSRCAPAGLHFPKKKRGQDVLGLCEGKCRKDSMLVRLEHKSDQRKEVGKHGRDHESYRKLGKAVRETLR